MMQNRLVTRTKLEESCKVLRASHVALVVTNQPAKAGGIRDAGSGGPLEEGVATHSSILAWRISWTEEPGGLQSMGSQGVRHN